VKANKIAVIQATGEKRLLRTEEDIKRSAVY
jgi:hypothetical protein